MKRGTALFFILLIFIIVAIDRFRLEREHMNKGSDSVRHSVEVANTKDLPGRTVKETKSARSPVIEKSGTDEETKTQEQAPKEQLGIDEKLSRLGAQMGDPVFIRIFKYSSELEVWIRVGKRYELLHTYDICAQSGILGPKLREGDLKNPEGFYFVGKRSLNPNSRFHLSFNIGYPNKYDRIHKRTGSAIMIHGDCVSVGCFAMTDEKIEEIYELVEKALQNGQKIVRVHIFPFRMTDRMMEKYRDKKWYPFWKNLKEGYDYFEEKGIPPVVNVRKRKYVFK